MTTDSPSMDDIFDESAICNGLNSTVLSQGSSASAKSTLNEVWPKPRLPSQDEFLGVITHMDREGQIYIQTEIGEKVSEAMTKILTKIHSSLQIEDICDQIWGLSPCSKYFLC